MTDHPDWNGSNRSDGEEEIFLSPRVVDEKAFASFAERLRALIEEARNVADSTKEAGDGAARLRSSLAGAGRELAARLASAERLLSDIDRKRQAAEQMYERAASRAASIAELEQAAQRIADEKRAAFEKSLDDAIKTADQRTRQIDLRLDQLSKQAERRADELTQRLDRTVAEAEARLNDLLQRLDGAIESSGVDERTKRLETACDRAEDLFDAEHEGKRSKDRKSVV